MTSPKPFKTAGFNYNWTPLGVAEPLETWWEPMCQNLTLGDALAPEL